jgi:hypothetical protein
MIVNKDIVYIVSFILIILNCIILNNNNRPFYTKHPLFHFIFMLCLVVILEYNIYIGFFVTVTYLNINSII